MLPFVRPLARSLLLIGMGMVGVGTPLAADEPAPVDQPVLRLDWNNRILTIEGTGLAGPVSVLYIEAYCRPGSTDRDWSKTVIRHQSRRVDDKKNPQRVEIEDRLADGVVVRHVITARGDTVDFLIEASNPTTQPSEVDWGQPCVRVDRFTGTTRRDARELYPAYIRKSFLFIDGKQARMPTKPWATKARYTPGQVYCPRGVDRNDVNPRPLSPLIPSNPLVGCYSADQRQIMAIAFVPCQEIFQGVISCLHSDFRIGGLEPAEVKVIRGKIYFMPADIDKLLARYRRDFHVANKPARQ